jgi:hypothetical protein
MPLQPPLSSLEPGYSRVRPDDAYIIRHTLPKVD